MNDMYNPDLKLTEDEKTKPYAKYYDWYSGPHDEAAMDAFLNHPKLDPSQALPISEVNELLKPGYLDGELGYCILPDGTGYMANHIKMPKATPEMFFWYSVWFAFEDLRYKIWYPAAHYAVETPEDQKEILLDDSLSWAERTMIKRTLIEDVGAGHPERIPVISLTPEQAGFDPEAFEKSGIKAWAFSPGGQDPIDIMLYHTFRDLPEGGCELRTRCWFGYGFKNEKPAKTLPDGMKIPDEIPMGAWIHNIKEYSRYRELIPKLYEEYGNEPLEKWL